MPSQGDVATVHGGVSLSRLVRAVQAAAAWLSLPCPDCTCTQRRSSPVASCRGVAVGGCRVRARARARAALEEVAPGPGREDLDPYLLALALEAVLRPRPWLGPRVRSLVGLVLATPSPGS